MQLAAATVMSEVPLPKVTKSLKGVLTGLLRTRELPADSRAFIAARLGDDALTKREASVLVRALRRATRMPLGIVAAAELVEDVSLVDATIECKYDKRHANNNFIPVDYDQLFDHYFQKNGKFRGSIAYKFAITRLPTSSEEDLEDLCVEAFTWCWHKDVLAWFDPTMSNFGAMIFWAVRNATCILMSKQCRNPLGALRAGSLLDTSDGNEDSSGVFLADRLLLNASLSNELYGSQEVREDVEQALATKLVLDQVAKRIAARGDVAVLAVFNLQREGLIHQQIAQRLGLSLFVVGAHAKAIRQIALATEDESFERKPRESKADALLALAASLAEAVPLPVVELYLAEV